MGSRRWFERRKATNRLTVEEAVRRLDALDTSNPEKAHEYADHVLLLACDVRVSDAYMRAKNATRGWWYA